MGQQIVANFAHCTMAAREPGDEVRGMTSLGVGVCYGEGKSNLTHDGHIRNVIADAGAG
jgi:hypothetical protein